VPVGIAVGAASGASLAVLLQPLRGGNHLDQALVTIGVAYIAADLLSSTFGATPLAANPPQALAGRIDVAGYGYPIYRLTFIGIAALVAVALHVIVQRTTAGVLLRAAISDPAMAAVTGLNVRRLRIVAFAAGGTLTVAAGVLGAPLLGPAPGVDTTVLVLCLIIVILGGARSVRGTLAAALLVGQVQTLGVVLAPELASFALFAVVLAVLALRGRTPTESVVRAA
jgi:branched-subunit amino acid ABC-type transport system permease component